MTGEPEAKRAPRPVADERAQSQDLFGLGEPERDAVLAWVGENLTLVRRSVSGQRILYWSLGIAFVVGLAAHIGGFLLKSWMTTEPLLLLADLLYALGWALWTGVVLVVFVQVYPEAKKRQYKRALDTYEAAPPASEESVARYRELAKANPGGYRPELATSLANLGIRLAALGRPADVLSATEESVAIRRKLAEANPERYRPDLAWSLRVLADALDLLGRGDDASAARSKAAALTGDSKATQSVRSIRPTDRPVA